MSIHKDLETIRRELVEKILKCLEGNAPKENFIELADNLKKTPITHYDPSLFQSFTILDFLSKQLMNGNEEIVSPAIVRESCTYMLTKLVPSSPYIS
ncbi:MAG TPA: hypothetical protein VLG12_05985 [Candidatus Saccharimonadales bacterium]|nr:hypothetical protein [Candidatus Saccharimonadales bacterium]